MSVAGLTVNYGGVCALDGVELEVAEGAFVGLIGANGAGKTTFIDAVSGLTPSRGQVVFGGQDISDAPPSRRARLGLGRTFQSLELFEDLTVRENLLVSAERTRWYAPVLDMVRPARQPAAEEAVRTSLELLEIDELADLLPGSLSLGQRKLVTVARALAGRPRCVLLDEPAAGLDSAESVALGHQLRRVVDGGATLLLVDHDVGLVLGVCDQIHVLEFGRMIASGTPDQIAVDKQVIRSYLGEDADDWVASEVVG
jgi:ABC-type branched-subunit amino acid transport system ATPase component